MNIFKKSLLATLCTLTLLVGSGSISGMQDNKSSGILSTMKNGFKSFGQILVKAYSGSSYCYTLLGYHTDPMFDEPDAHLARCTVMAVNSSKLAYNRYITAPLKQQKENSDHKAPEYVQEQSLANAKSMCRPYNLRDWLFFQYLKTFGYLTVYNGSGKNRPNHFDKNRHLAYADYNGGIYFPQGSFGAKLTPGQEATLAHEDGHHINRDTTTFKNDYTPPAFRTLGSSTYYKHEYLAQKRAIETLHKDKNYAAIACANKKWDWRIMRFLKDPYAMGVVDTLESLIKQNPDDKQLRSCIPQKMSAKQGSDQQPTWRSRYQEYCDAPAQLRKKIVGTCKDIVADVAELAGILLL